MSIYSQAIKPRHYFLAEVMRAAEQKGETVSLHKAKQMASMLYERQFPNGPDRLDYKAPADSTFDRAARRVDRDPRNEEAARRRVSQKRAAAKRKAEDS